ncbi:hypothetical protein CYMTET_43452 [Cymbomonas tetramitiformis]|uniref:Fibronectin type-III domain-containing protein n=1 Tax=Cymbomonas tetramitiformis TaxID=36881 RepID=A0AAE0C3T7_9CHLO|nr:hypothetical protein CYMTET_43452 [Cymbomonas tetramitiformis]
MELGKSWAEWVGGSATFQGEFVGNCKDYARTAAKKQIAGPKHKVASTPPIDIWACMFDGSLFTSELDASGYFPGSRPHFPPPLASGKRKGEKRRKAKKKGRGLLQSPVQPQVPPLPVPGMTGPDCMSAKPAKRGLWGFLSGTARDPGCPPPPPPPVPPPPLRPPEPPLPPEPVLPTWLERNQPWAQFTQGFLQRPAVAALWAPAVLTRLLFVPRSPVRVAALAGPQRTPERMHRGGSLVRHVRARHNISAPHIERHSRDVDPTLRQDVTRWPSEPIIGMVIWNTDIGQADRHRTTTPYFEAAKKLQRMYDAHVVHLVTNMELLEVLRERCPEFEWRVVRDDSTPLAQAAGLELLRQADALVAATAHAWAPLTMILGRTGTMPPYVMVDAAPYEVEVGPNPKFRTPEACTYTPTRLQQQMWRKGNSTRKTKEVTGQIEELDSTLARQSSLAMKKSGKLQQKAMLEEELQRLELAKWEEVGGEQLLEEVQGAQRVLDIEAEEELRKQEAEGTLPELPLPAAPTGVRIVSFSRTSLHVEWDLAYVPGFMRYELEIGYLPAGSEQCGVEQQSAMALVEGGDGPLQNETQLGPESVRPCLYKQQVLSLENRWTSDTLEGHTFWAVRVRARNNAGSGRYSVAAAVSLSSARPTDLLAPLTVVNVKPGSRRLEVRWEAPPDNGAPIVQYQALLLLMGTTPAVPALLAVQEHNVTETRVTFTCLVPSLQYAARVRVLNGAGYGNWSADLFHTVLLPDGRSSDEECLSPPTMMLPPPTDRPTGVPPIVMNLSMWKEIPAAIGEQSPDRTAELFSGNTPDSTEGSEIKPNGMRVASAPAVIG